MCSQSDDPTQHDGPVMLKPRTYVLSGTPPTHGRIVLMSPWARAGIKADDRHAVEAVIPAGYTINVLVTSNKAYWQLRVTGPSGYESRSLRLSHGMPLPAALRYAIAHWGLVDETTQVPT